MNVKQLAFLQDPLPISVVRLAMKYPQSQRTPALGHVSPGVYVGPGVYAWDHGAREGIYDPFTLDRVPIEDGKREINFGALGSLIVRTA